MITVDKFLFFTFIGLEAILTIGFLCMWDHQIKINNHAQKMFKLLGEKTGLLQ